MPISGNVEAQHGAHGAHDHAIQPSPLEQALASCSSVSADNGVGGDFEDAQREQTSNALVRVRAGITLDTHHEFMLHQATGSNT